MAMSAASNPFTVKGTRWMCTVWFVRFGWRQRGWAWAIIGIKARRAVRMLPRRLSRCFVRSCAVRLPVPAASSAANANANASSSSKINHLHRYLGRAEEESGRERLPSHSRAYPEAWGGGLTACCCLLVPYKDAKDY